MTRPPARRLHPRGTRTTRWLAGLASVLVCLTGCGKYGAPVRTTATLEAVPAAADADPEERSVKPGKEVPGR